MVIKLNVKITAKSQLGTVIMINNCHKYYENEIDLRPAINGALMHLDKMNSVIEEFRIVNIEVKPIPYDK